MKNIKNLDYTLEINYTNSSGATTSISVKFNDSGLKTKTTRIGNICITEETINGRVLSGRFDDSDSYCGYRYDYQKGETLLNINEDISINTAVSLINKKKMESDFMSADFVLSSILKNDYRVVTLDKGNLNIIKTISAENEHAEHYRLQESADFLKQEGAEKFVEQYKKRVYQIDDDCTIEDAEMMADSNIKSQLNELSEILSQNPQNYKELIELKNQIQNKSSDNSINEEVIL